MQDGLRRSAHGPPLRLSSRDPCGGRADELPWALMSVSNNLLARLHRLASRQDENFCTEVLAHLLQVLLAGSPQVGTALIGKLTNGRLSAAPGEADDLDVRTQLRAPPHGIPDLQIRTSDHMVLVEVKLEADLGPSQLRSYRQILLESGLPSTTLISLSRYRPTSLEPDDADFQVRWFEIADWLADIDREALDPASRFMVEEALGFLEQRGLRMNRITGELIEGVAALQSLLAMLAEILGGSGARHGKNNGAAWSGYSLFDGRVWLGLRYSAPNLLVMESDRSDLDRSRWEDLDVGAVRADSYMGWRWCHHLDLSDPELAFFDKTRQQQQEVLDGFLSRGLEAARTALAP